MGYGQTDRLLGLLTVTMSRRLFIFWLAIGIKWLYLTSAASEIVQTGVLGRSVTLPCTHSSWSRSGNSMCWGRGPCPNSKCNQEILHTDGTKVISRKSSKYTLSGNIQRGDVSLTIFNTNEDDSGVYCCRIEVPGWFNDVKKNVRLQLKRAPTTTRRTTTSRPTTTPPLTTTTTVLPTTVGTNPDLTTETTLQTTTAVLTTVTTTPPATTLASLLETSTGPLTTVTEGPILTPESETFLASSDSSTSVGITSADTPLLSSKASEAWVLPSTFQASTQQMNVSTPEESEIAILDGNAERGIVDPNEKVKMSLLMIVAPCVGFMVLALLAVLLLRGKVTKTNCLQEHTRISNAGETKNGFCDMQQGREDEEGLFTL